MLMQNLGGQTKSIMVFSGMANSLLHFEVVCNIKYNFMEYPRVLFGPRMEHGKRRHYNIIGSHNFFVRSFVHQEIKTKTLKCEKNIGDPLHYHLT